MREVEKWDKQMWGLGGGKKQSMGKGGQRNETVSMATRELA